MLKERRLRAVAKGASNYQKSHRMTISQRRSRLAPGNAPVYGVATVAGPALADRVANIAPFKVVEVLQRAKELERQGRQIVHFEVGEPDFPSAPAIVAAGIRALEAGHTGYSEALGLPALREAIAARYANYGLDAGRVAVTTGASGALNLLAQALINPGDEVLLADPGYPCNNVFVAAAGGATRPIAVDERTGFRLTRELVEAAWTPNTAGVLLASPSNPTGSSLPGDELAKIGEFARGRGFVIVDEIYQGLLYDGDAASTALAVDDGFFIVNSFSKYYGMTGWRLGWLASPAWAMDAIERIAQNLYIAPPTIAQYAGLEALRPSAIAVHEERRRIFAHRRDVLLEGLAELSLPAAHRPTGAFYAYVNISRTGLDAETFCTRLIEEFGVAVTPGTDFGEHRATDYVRFAFTVEERQIRLGLQRLAQALEKFKGA